MNEIVQKSRLRRTIAAVLSAIIIISAFVVANTLQPGNLAFCALGIMLLIVSYRLFVYARTVDYQASFDQRKADFDSIISSITFQ